MTLLTFYVQVYLFLEHNLCEGPTVLRNRAQYVVLRLTLTIATPAAVAVLSFVHTHTHTDLSLDMSV